MIKNKISLIISFSLFASGILLSYTYRPFIYDNRLYDYHIADTIGSLVCVPTSVFFLYSFSKTKNSFSILILKFAICFILYEFLSLTKLHGVFDFYDIIAILISAGGLHLFHWLYKTYKPIKNK